MRVFSDRDPAVNMYAGFQNDTFGNFGAGIDQAPGANNGRFMDFCLRAYKCRRMDHRHFSWLRHNWQNLVGRT